MLSLSIYIFLTKIYFVKKILIMITVRNCTKTLKEELCESFNVN